MLQGADKAVTKAKVKAILHVHVSGQCAPWYELPLQQWSNRSINSRAAANWPKNQLAQKKGREKQAQQTEYRNNSIPYHMQQPHKGSAGEKLNIYGNMGR